MTGVRAVHSERAPAAIGPYSQGVWAGDLFFSAGQVGLDPETGELVSGGAEEEVRQALRNLREVLGAAGLGPGDVVKATLFLADMDDFEAVNRAYGEFFGPPHPARSAVQVARLPRDARVEVEVVARAATG